jgi:glucose/arabinose dehydrogenase
MTWNRTTRLLAAAGVVVAVLGGIAAAVHDPTGASDTRIDTGSSTTSSLSSTTGLAAPPSSRATSSSTTTTSAPPATAATVPTTRQTSPTTVVPPFSSARIKLTPVATLSYPLAMAVRPSDKSIWMALKGGAICKLTAPTCATKRTIGVSAGNEQGLLGMTFGDANTLYTSYTFGTQRSGAGSSFVDKHVMTGDAVGPGAHVLTVAQPYSNHNGGNIAMGPDGRLWLGLGDGGSGGDPQNHAQTDGDLLGKILRVDTTGGGNHEIVIKGVRNPWRWSFDRSTGALWIGDVGQSAWEEIDYLAAGQQAGRNLGWRRYEGNHVYNGGGSIPSYVPPIYEYGHPEGCAITGGYAYRGARIPALRGAFLFADNCGGEIQAITQSGGKLRAHRRFGVNPGNVASFGQDSKGEIYVMTPTTLLRIDAA